MNTSSDWSAGYVTEIDYTYGYYAELNPLRATFAFLNASLKPPENGVHCELGFGQGLSVNIHAAASGSTWYANDFNPSQAAFAQEMAMASGSNAILSDESFSDFCSREDLPEFDSIGLHGIWTWISDQNREVIVDFVRRKLKAGGVLYISYNTQPGWASRQPMRELMNAHGKAMGNAGGGVVSRVEGALNFTEKLTGLNTAYLRVNPQVAEWIKGLKEHKRDYLAHEYFNRDWEPMSFLKMAEWFEKAKLSYACSATYLEHLDKLNLSVEQLTFLREIPDLNFREYVRDLIVNEQFRRDYWVKGERKLNLNERALALRSRRVILQVPRSEIDLTVKGIAFEAKMEEKTYAPILDALADYQPKTIGQVESLTKKSGVGIPQIMEAMMVLVGRGYVAEAQSEETTSIAKAYCDRLNAYIIEKASVRSGLGYLASPVSGGGIVLGRFQQLFLLASQKGRKSPEEWANFAWDILSNENQTIVKDGNALKTPEENLAELIAQAKTFAEKHLPILTAQQIT